MQKLRRHAERTRRAFMLDGSTVSDCRSIARWTIVHLQILPWRFDDHEALVRRVSRPDEGTRGSPRA